MSKHSGVQSAMFGTESFRSRSQFEITCSAYTRCLCLCLHCLTGRYANSMESEEHVIVKCDAYADIRDDLFAHVRTIYPHFYNLSDSNKFSFILLSHLTTAQSALTCHNILQRRRNLMYR